MLRIWGCQNCNFVVEVSRLTFKISQLPCFHYFPVNLLWWSVISVLWSTLMHVSFLITPREAHEVLSVLNSRASPSPQPINKRNTPFPRLSIHRWSACQTCLAEDEDAIPIRLMGEIVFWISNIKFTSTLSPHTTREFKLRPHKHL